VTDATPLNQDSSPEKPPRRLLPSYFGEAVVLGLIIVVPEPMAAVVLGDTLALAIVVVVLAMVVVTGGIEPVTGT